MNSVAVVIHFLFVVPRILRIFSYKKTSSDRPFFPPVQTPKGCFNMRLLPVAGAVQKIVPMLL